MAAGTARPTSASQASPGRMNSAVRSGNGRYTRAPAIAALTVLRLRRLTPLTTAEAITNDAVAATAPANGTIASVCERENPAATALRNAGGRPITMPACQCSPYSFSVSATSCPIVRLTGGRGGGSGPVDFG